MRFRPDFVVQKLGIDSRRIVDGKGINNAVFVLGKRYAVDRGGDRGFAPAAEQISLLHQFRRVPLRFPFLGFCASHRRLAVVYDIIAFELLHGAVFIDAELFSVAEYEFHAFAPFFFFII